MSNWEEKGIYGYAEEWFTKNGYIWKLKKEARTKNIYSLSKDGYKFEYEIPSAVTNPKKFMDFVNTYFDLYKRTQGK